MTALAANSNRRSKMADIKAYPVKASAVIFKGAIVAIDAAGFAIAATSAAGLKVVGVAHEKVTGTAVDGAVLVRVASGRVFFFAASSITQAMLGTAMLVIDDNTVDETSAGASLVGKMAEFVSTTECGVFIPVGGPGQ